MKFSDFNNKLKYSGNRFEISPSRYWMTFLFFTLIVTITYSFLLSSEFLSGFDDDWGITENSLVQNLTIENIRNIWANNTKDSYYIPLTFTSFALDVSIWGNNAFYMKLENLFFFILTAFLIDKILFQINTPNIIKLFVFIMFTTHPMQIESIAWPANRRQVLSLLFLSATILSFIKSQISSVKNNRILYYILSAFMFFLAMASKPTSIFLLPLAAFLILLRQMNNNFKLNLFFRDTILFVPFLVISLLFIVLNIEAGERNFMYQDMGYTPIQHFLLIGGSFGFYIEQLFWGPYSIFYPADTPYDFNYNTYLFRCILTLILVSIFILSIVKRRYLSGLSIGYFLLALAPPSLLILIMSDLPMNTADRYFYIASPGIFIAMGFLANHFAPRYMFVISWLMGIFFMIQTCHQLSTWQNVGTVLQHNTKHYPSEEMFLTLADFYYQRGEKEKAFEQLNKADHLKKNILFNVPFMGNIKRAWLYQQKGDTTRSLSIMANAFKSDLQFKENADDDIIYKASYSIIPLDEDLNKNYIRYYEIRDSLIKNNPDITLKEMRW